MSRYAVVVDPLSTGREYAAAFRAAGMTPVAALSAVAQSPARRAQWRAEDFDHLHPFDGDLEGLAAALRRHDPACLVPGAETGVELYEALVPLVLPGSGNVPELAAARRDKWAMAQALADAGIPHLRQFCSADPDAIAAWLEREGLADRPLVVKPPKGGGTVDVYGLPPGGDWRPLFDRIVGRVNATGAFDDALLVQEFARAPSTSSTATPSTGATASSTCAGTRRSAAGTGSASTTGSTSWRPTTPPSGPSGPTSGGSSTRSASGTGAATPR